MKLRWPVTYGYGNKRKVWFTLIMKNLYIDIYPGYNHIEVYVETDPPIKEMSESKNIDEELLREGVKDGVIELTNMYLREYYKTEYDDISAN